jgi:hypothetical protein
MGAVLVRFARRHFDAAGAGVAGFSKLTAGGVLIWASFCTAKLGDRVAEQHRRQVGRKLRVSTL